MVTRPGAVKANSAELPVTRRANTTPWTWRQVAPDSAGAHRRGMRDPGRASRQVWVVAVLALASACPRGLTLDVACSTDADCAPGDACSDGWCRAACTAGEACGPAETAGTSSASRLAASAVSRSGASSRSMSATTTSAGARSSSAPSSSASASTAASLSTGVPPATVVEAVVFAQAGATVDVAMPQGTHDGDLAILQLAFDNGLDTSVGATPDGWLLLGRWNNDDSLGQAVYTKMLGANEPGVTFTATDNVVAGLLVYRGAGGVSLLGYAVGTNATPTAPAVTSLRDGSTVLWLFAHDASVEFSNTDGATRQYSLKSNRSLLALDSFQRVAGGVGALAVTVSASNQWIASVVEVLPAQ